MRKIVGTSQELCVGCNRCTRVCPIETANHTYQDAGGDIKVKVDPERCIACGECLSACRHGARYYMDDLDRFLADLAAGKKIYLMVAPAVRTNFPDNWKNVLAWFKSLGVAGLYDVSLGADLCIWAHLRWLEQNPDKPIVTQPCPAIVSYTRLYNHKLLENLSPVQSPMGSTVVLMRQYEKLDGAIAAFSPCIAKGHEFEDIGVEYNLGFSHVAEYWEKHGVALPEAEAGYDHDEAGMGSLFPMPGGLKENIEFFTGKKLNVYTSEGREAYKNLDDYAKTPDELKPDVFDVLNCEEGCNNGPGCIHGRNFFQTGKVMDKKRRVAEERGREYYDGVLAEYDRRFELSDFLRDYTAYDVALPEVGEADIQKAFDTLGKNTPEKQVVDCGSCGNDSCRDMARRIALNVNIPLNCIMKSRDDMQASVRRNEQLYKRNAEYVWLIHRIGDYLLAAEDEDRDEVVKKSLEALCGTMGGTSASVWKNHYDSGGRICCDRLAGWPGKSPFEVDRVREDHMPGWAMAFLRGEHVLVRRSTMRPSESMLFADPSVNTMLLVPVLVRGRFWGLFSINCAQERTFDEEEISVAVASGMLIVYSIIEREMTQNLITAREEALAGTRAKSDFLSSMSHEMRTPMNAIIGMAKIAEGAADPQRIRYCLSTIQSSSAQLLGLINDVLDMSKIEAGKFELSEAPFRLDEMLERAAGFVAETLERKNQELVRTIDPACADWYMGDELRICQVVTNFLSNAVKFTGEEGRVRLTAEAYMAAGNTADPNAPQRRLVQISVADDGIGMTREQISRLFNAFEQADSSIQKRFGGSGLGLAISKNIVEQMGGRITVESEPNQGSTFMVEVELAVAEAPAQPPKAAVAEGAPDKADMPTGEAAPEQGVPVAQGASDLPDFTGLRLLLAEDIEINREVFIALLECTGITIEVAENGRVAVEKFSREPDGYDIVVMDIMMPEMDGYDATRLIRALPNGKGATVPIIAMTANAFREDIDRCLASGMNDHLSKPIDDTALMDKISYYCKK